MEIVPPVVDMVGVELEAMVVPVRIIKLAPDCDAIVMVDAPDAAMAIELVSLLLFNCNSGVVTLIAPPPVTKYRVVVPKVIVLLTWFAL
jgi:hypothetical protein